MSRSAGALILRGILAIPFLMMLAMIGAVGFIAVEPVYQMVTGNGLAVIGGAQPGNVLLMMGISMIGLPLVVILWWWIAPLKNDVRQGVRRP